MTDPIEITPIYSGRIGFADRAVALRVEPQIVSPLRASIALRR